jgi:hypothetical protein
MAKASTEQPLTPVLHKPLPEDLAAFRESYAKMFGFVPPLPAAKFQFSSEDEQR